MTSELEIKLVKKYPKILKDYKGDPKTTCMAWGISTDCGWFELLDKCMEALQYFCDSCSKDGREVQVVADQIKEKFGSLCFYYSAHNANEIETHIIDSIVSAAEKKSKYVCEISGEHGELCIRSGWYKTLCREEARKLGFLAYNKETEEWWKKKDLEKNSSNSETSST